MLYVPIKNWDKQNLICFNCGTNKLVRYKLLGKSYCVDCIIDAMCEEDDTEYNRQKVNKEVRK